MRNRVQLASTALAMALLVVGLPAAAAAQTEGGPQVGAPAREYVPIPKVMLTGMLKSDGADGYLLVDQQSGDSIELKKKSKKLAQHEGTMVAVEGKWADNDPTSKVFKVSKVEPAPEAAAEPQAAPSIDPAAPAPVEPSAAESPEIPEAPEAPAPEAPEAPDPESPESAPQIP